jgi:hypothetical protein
MKNEINPCPECGQQFDNVFEATDHLVDEGDEFDPALVLPNGYRLMIGSLLRCMYRYANDKEQIEKITQDTYMTLYLAEISPNTITDILEDSIVGSSMVGIDEELKQLLEDGE